MISNIKNGQLAKKKIICQTRKKLCENTLKLLWDEGFISGYRISNKQENTLEIFLKYLENGKPVINRIEPLSKPSKRLYYTSKQIWKLTSSKGFIILSTNKGLKSMQDCKKLKIGGEPLIILS